MADISINKFTSVVKLQGNSASVPSLPQSLEDTPPAVNPPGTGVNPSASTFLQLTDTPASYTGNAGLFPRVNSGESALEFFNPLSLPLTGYTVGSNTALADTDTILGAFGKVQGQINAKIGGTIASGQVAFGTGTGTIGGDSGLVWDNVNKRLGVGTSSPAHQFHLVRATFPTMSMDVGDGRELRIQFQTVSNTADINSIGAYPLTFRTTNTERMRIDASGNVGIGTTSTTDYRLRLSGSAFVSLPANGYSNIVNNFNVFGPSSTGLSIGTHLDGEGFGADIVFRGFSTTLGDLRFISINGSYLSPVERMRISSSGNVGIGTNAPTNTFDVNGTARIRTLSNATGDFVTASATGVLQKRTAAETLADIGGIGGSGTTNYIPKFTTSGTIGNSAVFESGGNVGIGTASPTQKLHVNGSLRVNGGALFYSTVNTNRRFTINSNNPDVVTLYTYDNVATTFHSVELSGGSTSAGNGLLVNNLGNVGIKTTTPTNTLDVNGTARIRTLSNATGDFVTASATGVLQKRTASETLADIGAIGGNGTTNYIPKFTASGTIGNSQIFDNGTNVGIGTSSPNDKLDVANGNIYLGYSTGTQQENALLGFLKTDQFPANGLSIPSYGLKWGTISGGNVGVHISSFGGVLLYSGNVERFRLTRTGELGLNTTSPTNTLDVNGTARIRTLSNATGDFVTASATGVLQKRTPNELKSDLGLGSNLNDILITTNSTLSVDAGARFYKQAEHGTVVQGSSGSVNQFALLTSGGGLKLIVNNSGDIILNQFDGLNVGIGNITPSERLDVDGTARLRGIASGTGDAVVVDSNGKLWKGGTFISATESTFTPSLSDVGGGVSYTISSAYGSYYKMGKQVFFTLTILIDSSSGSGSGSLTVTGLPFTYNSLNSGATCAVTISAFTGSSLGATDLEKLSANIVDGESRVIIRTLTGTLIAPTFSSGILTLAGVYTTNS